MDLGDMSEPINEPVSVILWTNHITRHVLPYAVYWHGRRYQMTKVGLHHTYRAGQTLMHVFSVTDGSVFFRLEMNAETLDWRLLDVAS